MLNVLKRAVCSTLANKIGKIQSDIKNKILNSVLLKFINVGHLNNYVSLLRLESDLHLSLMLHKLLTLF